MDYVKDFRKLSKMPYAQAIVKRYADGSIILQSYATDVIIINPDGWLSVTGLYSATTRKHISAFMSEYTPFGYYTAKKCYEDDVLINIFTAEVKAAQEA